MSDSERCGNTVSKAWVMGADTDSVFAPGSHSRTRIEEKQISLAICLIAGTYVKLS